MKYLVTLLTVLLLSMPGLVMGQTSLREEADFPNADPTPTQARIYNDVGINYVALGFFSDEVSVHFSIGESEVAIIDFGFNMNGSYLGDDAGIGLEWTKGYCAGDACPTDRYSLSAITGHGQEPNPEHGIAMGVVVETMTSITTDIIPVRVAIAGVPAPQVVDYHFADALHHIIDLVDSGTKIRSVSTSILLSSPYTIACDSAYPLSSSAINQLKVRKVLVTGAAGNAPVQGSVFPACLNDVISVSGAYYRSSVQQWIKDPTTAYGDSIDILAPSAYRSIGVIGTEMELPNSGYTFITAGGTIVAGPAGFGSTSVASATVAGALATVTASQPLYRSAIEAWDFIEKNSKVGFGLGHHPDIYKALDFHEVLMAGPEPPVCWTLQMGCPYKFYEWEVSVGTPNDIFGLGDIFNEKCNLQGGGCEELSGFLGCWDFGWGGIFRSIRTTAWGTASCEQSISYTPCSTGGGF